MKLKFPNSLLDLTNLQFVPNCGVHPLIASYICAEKKNEWNIYLEKASRTDPDFDG